MVGPLPKSLLRRLKCIEKKLDTKLNTVITSGGYRIKLGKPNVDILDEFKSEIEITEIPDLARGLLYIRQVLVPI